MRPVVDVSLRSGVLPVAMLLAAFACQAGGAGGKTVSGTSGGSSNGSGATSSLGTGGDIVVDPGNSGGMAPSLDGTIMSDSRTPVTGSGATKELKLTLPP